MTCASCQKTCEVAAYAIMHEDDLKALGVEPTQKGPGKFHAAPVCKACYETPDERPRQLKAHFALPDTHALFMALGTAGSSGSIG